MGNQIVWSGLEDLKTQLRALPAALTDDAAGLAAAAAEGAKADMHYPGDLGDRVVVKTMVSGPFAATAVITNPHILATIFENGTQARHYVTTKGVTHLTGQMPPGHVFVPAVLRWRRAMYDALKARLATHGLQVSGDAG